MDGTQDHLLVLHCTGRNRNRITIRTDTGEKSNMGSYSSHPETVVNNDGLTTQQEQEMCCCPDDKTLKFVSRKDDITGDDDPNTQRVEMSCGHAATPESLTGWCRSLLDQGHYNFTCPAVKDLTTGKCGKEWPYQEVRKLALLTDSEQRHFEETMAALAVEQFCEYKSCPGCKTFVERKTVTNLRVHCTVCTAKGGRTYDFCWQCLREWKGPAPRSDRCNNDDCTNKNLDLLKNCSMTTLPSVKSVQCPSIRACPNCGRLIEHDKSGCKYMICSRCRKEFCFVCLKLKSCHPSQGWFELCPDGVSPRQTSVPTWNR